jgi:hypothetical protein
MVRAMTSISSLAGKQALATGGSSGTAAMNSDDPVKGIRRPATTAHEAVRNTAATIEESR